jgi:hypothetical protein
MRSRNSGTSLISLSIVITTLAACREAPAQPAREPQQAPARPTALPVDLEASRVYVKVGSSRRLGHEHAVEGRLSSGKLELGGGGDLAFDMRSFVADAPDARTYVRLKGNVSAADQQKVTATMLGDQVLGVGQFPQATYKISAAKPVDGQAPGAPGRYKLDGQFTLHGATHPLSFMATVERNATSGAVEMRGSFAIDQSHFGIRPYTAVAGLVGVADRLEIWGDLRLRSVDQNTRAPSGKRE